MIKIIPIKLLIILLLLTSCSSPATWQNNFLPPYQKGQLSRAIFELEKIKQEELPSDDFRRSKDSVWFYLNLATMQFAKGDMKQARHHYKLALEALHYFNPNDTQDYIKEFLLEDQLSAYRGPLFEQTLARLYFALTLFKINDYSNARAMLRNAEEFSESQNAPNPLCKYLFALLLEKEGDESNAKILYDQAESLLGRQVERGNKDLATVLVICHNGNAPYKFSGYAPASASSLLLLENFLVNFKKPIALSCLPGLNVPFLAKNHSSFALKTKAYLDGRVKTLTPFFSVDYALSKTLKEERPYIEARSLARYLIRRSLLYAVQEKNEDVAALVDVGFLIANAFTEADTRSWSTLPSQIDVARFDIHEGKHILNFQIGSKSLSSKELEVKNGRIYVINIFNIHPHIPPTIL